MIPVGLDVFRMDFGHRIDKEQRMVHCSVSQTRNIPDPDVCRHTYVTFTLSC